MTRAKWLGWVAFLGVLGVLGFLSAASAEPNPSGAPAGRIDRVACARAPGVPDHVDIWVVLGSGRIFYDKPLFHKNLPSDAVVYVYKPNDSTCRKKESTAAVTQAAKEPKKTAPPEKVAPPKPGEKPKAQNSPKAAAKATTTEAHNLDKRRQRAQKAQPNRRALPKAASEDDLAKEDDASAVPLAKHSEKAAPVTASACPTCGTKQAPAASLSLCGAAKAAARMPAGTAENPNNARVREPILATLLALEVAKSAADKETNRQKLRGLFEKNVSPSLAQAFQGMLMLLGTKDPVARTFQRVLANDPPLRKELVEILEKKYICPPPAAPPSPAVASQAPEVAQGMTLPVVNFSDAAAFEAFHAQLASLIAEMRASCDRIVTDNLKVTKTKLIEKHVELLEKMLPKAQSIKDDAFLKTDPATRAQAIKVAGAAYTAPFVLIYLWSLYINIAIGTDVADVQGVPSLPAGLNPWGESALNKRIREFENDKDLRELTQAALYADVERMNKAFPAASAAYERHLQSLDAWMVEIQRGAEYSRRAIFVANLTTIAISFYQLYKAPALLSGGPPQPPVITGVLPGGLALGARISPVRLAEALETIRHLIKIGALDGAIVGSVGLLGGGPNVSIPELQRPTSLAIKKPGQGTSTQTSQSPGTSATKVATPFPRKSLRGVSLKWLQRNKPNGWRQEPADNGQGWKWLDENGIERLRFTRPSGKNPSASQWSRQANGYFRWQNAKGEFLDADGNVVSSSSQRFQELTHIMYEGL